MANHASAAKRNRQRIKATTRNRTVKSALRTVVRKARAAVASGADNAAELVKEATSALDVASKKGVIPDERASRVKGRIAKGLSATKK